MLVALAALNCLGQDRHTIFVSLPTLDLEKYDQIAERFLRLDGGPDVVSESGQLTKSASIEC